ncbi:dnaJ homolog subfamily C member 21 [Sesamum indicum]|uniref:DnaJ homolog subfamily C member 21 n=1 Tax=Sesamum indicum TaxID=4182 RepID=A0A6I9SP40_SESIN|nr:dnaJ homolog subfamily C member 21 [Sesamum indicum]
MGMIVGNEQEKSQLATEICELLARASACAKFHHSRRNKPPFINWYLVLRVNENADVDGIRKQYHKLALQLHPDKNKHSKAETAFKLVSEAYYCLSDNGRRAAFDLERKTISCSECNTIPRTNSELLRHTNVKIQTPYKEPLRFSQINRRIKELRTKLKEEATIIEKCLKTNAITSRKDSPNINATREKELPVFNPSNYQYKGYPHHRTINHKQLEDLRAGLMIGNRCMQNTAKNSCQIFQY